MDGWSYAYVGDFGQVTIGPMFAKEYEEAEKMPKKKRKERIDELNTAMKVLTRVAWKNRVFFQRTP